MKMDKPMPPAAISPPPVQKGAAALRRSRILVVEDDTEIAQEVVGELGQRGYATETAEDGPAAVSKASTEAYDLLIMDRKLPGMDGLAVIERLRAENIRVPVLVLSALGGIDDRVNGLKAGGDDYLTKPFAVAELMARVEALLRRPAETRETMLRVGELTLDLIDREARRGSRVIELLPREFKLLEYMMRRSGQVVTRAMLLEDVWHYRFVPETNLVDVHIGKLRRKVDTPEDKPMFESVRGVGFVLNVPDAEP
jgi:two-component system OmpR family response regulator